MNVKLFELRDSATFIPIFAFRARPEMDMAELEQYLIRRAGFNYDSNCIIMGRLECSGIDRNCTYDAYAWGTGIRTFHVAHKYLEEHFDELESGSLIDVEFILGLRDTPKVSESKE